MNRLFGWLARVAVGRQVLAGLAKVHNALDGHRSEIALAVLAVVHVLKLAEVLSAPAAASVETALLAILPVTLADKASKAISISNQVAQAPADAAPEPPKQ